MTRWKVEITSVSGDIVAETLAAAGFDLHGDLLSGEPFEALDDWGAVSDAARELGQKITEIARLNPDLEIGFESGPVYEYDSDGNQIGKNHKVYLQGATSVGLAGQVVAVENTSISPEEKAEFERQARAEKAAQLMRAVMRSDLVLTVLRLFEGEPWGTELGHVHKLIQYDMDGDLSRFGTRNQFERFNRSINHPGVLGLKARHAVTNDEPPPDPMNLKQATQFIRDVADKWIKEKAAT